MTAWMIFWSPSLNLALGSLAMASARVSMLSATMVFSVMQTLAQLWLEPGARNSNLFPVKAKGLVRLRSVASRGKGGRVSMPMRRGAVWAPLARAPRSMRPITSASSSPRKMEMMEGGASLAPRRWSLPAPAVAARRMSACRSTARMTLASTAKKMAFSCGFCPGSSRFLPL